MSEGFNDGKNFNVTRGESSLELGTR